MAWGRTKKNARNGGWVDCSNGKGSGGHAAGGGGGQQARSNRGDSWGTKNARPKEVVLAFLKAWTAEQTKKLDSGVAFHQIPVPSDVFPR